MPCSSAIGIRRSCPSVTTAYAASTPLSTSGVRDSGISTTCRAASTPGPCSSIRRCRATKRVRGRQLRTASPCLGGNDRSSFVQFEPASSFRETFFPEQVACRVHVQPQQRPQREQSHHTDEGRAVVARIAHHV